MKKIITIFLCLFLIAALAGCKGKRSVKVEIDYDDFWSGTLKADNETTYPTANKSDTIIVVSSVSNLDFEASKSAATPLTMTVRIVEEYEAGFLYLESREVLDEDWTVDMAIPAVVTWKFESE